mgnify:CR=1 FL=1
MKKLFSMMAVLAAMFAFVACSETPDGPNDEPKGKLATPELTSTTTETSFTIAWNAVSGADAYMVNFDGKNYTTAELSYTFENLNAGEYSVRVKATGKGYEDSDNAKIVVTLTGLTEADWFSQELFLAEDAEEGITKFNSVWFTWKGTGIADVQYGLFETASLEGATDADIKGALKSIPSDQISTILSDVNGAEGFTSVFGPGLYGSTSYTLYTLVKNAEGLEFLTKSEITTEALVLTDAAKAWLGTWTVKSHQIYSIEQTGAGTKSAKEDEFTVTITAGDSASNEVRIDGLSVLGSDWPTYGIVEGDTLYILNGIYLGSDECHYYWVGFYDEPIGISTKEYPSNVVTIAADGATATSTNKITFQDESGADLVIECFCSDVMGVTDDGYIQFFIEAFPAVFRTGDMEWTKTGAATAALNTNARTVKSSIKTSIVVK